jgi:hypothetical protein
MFGKKKEETKKRTVAKTTQSFLRILEVRDDILVMEDGTLRAILAVSSTNFDLKNVDEQNALIMSYQRFLNSLDFSIQILMQSRRMDIADYTAKLKQMADKQSNELLRIQTTEYIEFVSRLVETANIMNKSFYVIIPLEFSILPTKKGFFTKLFRNVEAIDTNERIKKLDELRLQLDERVSSVLSNLSGVGLRVAKLSTEQIIELMYNSYNFDSAPSIDAAQLPNVTLTEVQEQAPT